MPSACAMWLGALGPMSISLRSTTHSATVTPRFSTFRRKPCDTWFETRRSQ